MKIIIWFLSLLSFQGSLAQTGDLRADTDIIFNDLNRLRSKTYSNVEGSPFYTDKWETGNIVLHSQATFKDVMLNVDLHTHELHYMKDQVDLIIDTEKIKEVQIKIGSGTSSSYHIFRAGLPAVGRNTSKTFYRVVAEEQNNMLLKLIRKTIKSGDEFDKKSEFTLEESSYLFINNEFIELRSKKILLKQFPDKREELDQFINANSISFSDDEDLIGLFLFLSKML